MSLLYGVRCVFSCMVCHCFVVLLVRSPPLPVLLLLPSPVGFTPWIRKPTHFAVPPRRLEEGEREGDSAGYAPAAEEEGTAGRLRVVGRCIAVSHRPPTVQRGITSGMPVSALFWASSTNCSSAEWARNHSSLAGLGGTRRGVCQCVRAAHFPLVLLFLRSHFTKSSVWEICFSARARGIG